MKKSILIPIFVTIIVVSIILVKESIHGKFDIKNENIYLENPIMTGSKTLVLSLYNASNADIQYDIYLDEYLLIKRRMRKSQYHDSTFIVPIDSLKHEIKVISQINGRQFLTSDTIQVTSSIWGRVDFVEGKGLVLTFQNKMPCFD